MSDYIGRFAPSPTGQLHFGSLLAALASYVDARQNNGQWLLRIDDVDQTREIPGSAEDIMHTLEDFGFQWDNAIVRQTEHLDDYQQHFEQLLKQGDVYPCTCSRKTIAQSAIQGIDGFIYPGTCKTKTAEQLDLHQAAWRLNISSAEDITVNDLIQKPMQQNLHSDVGDFIIRRKDQFFAYQFAVVIDDLIQNISHVIRGADIYPSTPRQVYLQRILNIETPIYAHIPLALDSKGKKISKSAQSIAVNRQQPLAALIASWDFLNQPTIHANSVDSFWRQAIPLWDISAISSLKTEYQQ